MAFQQGTVSVGTTATVICTVGSTPENDGVLVQNNGSAAVFLGGPSVTATGATAGLQVAAGDTVRVPTTGADTLVLYGIVASSTAPVSYLFPA